MLGLYRGTHNSSTAKEADEVYMAFSSTTYLQARTWEVHLDFVPASQLEYQMGLEEACWDPSFLHEQ